MAIATPEEGGGRKKAGGRGGGQGLPKTYDEELNELHRVVQG